MASSIQAEAGRAITAICFNQVFERWLPLVPSSCRSGVTTSRTIGYCFSAGNTGETST